jgi:hypothetical protein
VAEIDVIRSVLDVGIATALIIGGIRGWYVWGPIYQDVVRQRDYWQGRSEKNELALERLLAKAEGKP